MLLPIQYSAVFEMYKKHEASFWTAEEIDLASDTKDWEALTEKDGVNRCSFSEMEDLSAAIQQQDKNQMTKLNSFR